MRIGSEVPGKYQENIIAWRENNPTYEVGQRYRHQRVETFLRGSLVDGQLYKLGNVGEEEYRDKRYLQVAAAYRSSTIMIDC